MPRRRRSAPRSRRSRISIAGCGRSSPRAAPRGPTSRSTPSDVVAFVARQVDRRARRGRARRAAPRRPLPRVRVREAACRARSPRSTATTCARSTSRSRGCGSAPPRLADVKQLVRQRLFVGGGTAGAPTSAGKIAEYGGRGDLRRWVRSVAVRTCLNDLRKGKREILVDDDQLIAQHAIAGRRSRGRVHEADVRGRVQGRVRRRARAARRRASRRCCATTTSTGSTSTRSARSTASTASPRSAGSRRPRSSSCARRSSTLRARLKLPADELDSVLRMIRSQIHLSLVRHLGGPNDSVDDDAIELDPSELEEVDEHVKRAAAGSRGELAIAALVIAVVAMLIVPLPRPLLDVLLALNIGDRGRAADGGGVHAAAAARSRSFPTLLVVTTLFRVGLEVSTTRLILADADAGEVVHAFGIVGRRGQPGGRPRRVRGDHDRPADRRRARRRARRRGRGAVRARRDARQADGDRRRAARRARSTPRPRARGAPSSSASRSSTARWTARCGSSRATRSPRS